MTKDELEHLPGEHVGRWLERIIGLVGVLFCFIAASVFRL